MVDEGGGMLPDCPELVTSLLAQNVPRSWGDRVNVLVQLAVSMRAHGGGSLLIVPSGSEAWRERSHSVDRVVITEPVVGASPATVHAGQLGGTRHLSAAQFIHDQPDALALVASQDGRFTIFSWSPCEQRVHAHRVEALLL